MKTIKLLSNAKLNLALEIINKREDGYHNLNSIFVPISLHDVIVIEENSNQLEFSITPTQNLPIHKNLIYIATKKFLETFQLSEPKLSIKLEKIIPIGAGLGGGSSNAAFILKGLNEYFELGKSDEELILLGKQLGADVPFFIKNRPSIVTGIGDKMEEINLQLNYKLLLVNPKIHVNTTSAYKSLNHIGINKASDFKSIIQDIGNVSLKENLRNDFETSVFKNFPEINFIKKKMYENGAIFSLMTGSGSTVFGLFDNEESYKKAYFYFDNYFEDYRTYSCEFI